MTNRMNLVDSRSLTLEDGDRLLGEIMVAEAQRLRLEAAAERKIAELRAACQEQTAAYREQIEGKAALLTQLILAHPAWFQKPRARKCPHGEYGRRRVPARLVVANAEALLAELKAKAMTGCIRTVETVDAKGVAAALAEGAPLEHARIESGERAYYKLDEGLLRRASEVQP